MRALILFARASLAAFLCLTPLGASDAETDHRLERAATLFSTVMGAPDTAIPRELVEKASCIVMVPARDTPPFQEPPSQEAKRGRGFLSCRMPTTLWSAPGAIGIEGGKIELQVGAFSADMILLVMNQRTADKILADKFTLGSDATVEAGPVGNTTPETDAQQHADILSWSRLQSMLTGFPLEGAAVQEDLDENAKIYGKPRTNVDIVTSETSPPVPAEKLIKQLNRYSDATTEKEKKVPEKSEDKSEK